MPSSAGEPVDTLLAIRPQIEEVISQWAYTSSNSENNNEGKSNQELIWKWSPLFKTEPMGGPKGQNPFINAVLVVEGNQLEAIQPCKKKALNLLNEFFGLEKKYGRHDIKTQSIRWGPRTLDIDLLAWGNFQMKSKKLTIPHPRIFERSFVIVPLGAAISSKENPPKKIIKGGWPESQ